MKDSMVVGGGGTRGSDKKVMLINFRGGSDSFRIEKRFHGKERRLLCTGWGRTYKGDFATNQLLGLVGASEEEQDARNRYI